MKNWLRIILFIVGCELVGGLGTVFTLSAIPTWYAHLNKPSFAPPNWIFGPVWTLLYLLMGVAAYLVWQHLKPKILVQTAKKFFMIQLGLNFIWTPIFFGLKSPVLGLIIILAMWLMIVLTIKNFYSVSKMAAALLIPYLLWVSFASVLNAAIVMLN